MNDYSGWKVSFHWSLLCSFPPLWYSQKKEIDRSAYSKQPILPVLFKEIYFCTISFVLHLQERSNALVDGDLLTSLQDKINKSW